MSHRNHWTHTLTATRKEQVGEGAHGDPVHGDATVLEDEPVRYRPGGTEYVRSETGERVERAPSVKGRAVLADQLQEGDAVTLRPLSGGTPIEGLEVAGIDETYGRTARSAETIVELESI